MTGIAGDVDRYGIFTKLGFQFPQGAAFAVLADDDRGDALAGCGARVRIAGDIAQVVAVGVDETRSEDEVLAVDDLFAFEGFEGTDGDDFMILNADLAGVGGFSGAVEQADVRNQRGGALREAGEGKAEPTNKNDKAHVGLGLHENSQYFGNGRGHWEN